MDEYNAKQEIIEAGSRLYARGYIVAGEGNLSVRLNEEEILATPAGKCKGFLKPEELIKTDMQGNKLSGKSDLEPSSELKMHLAIYQERRDVCAVVHAHPPTATGFAVAGVALDRCVLPEIILTVGSIPLADYGTPSTEEIPNKIREIIRGRDALLMANHGALTVGKDIFTAFYHMESIEQFAKIVLTARILGGERVLDSQEIRKLIETHPGNVDVAKMCIPKSNSIDNLNKSTHIPSCAKEEGHMAQAELVMKITKEIMKRLQSNSS